ncbi:MAG: FRG domain-containing protein [Bryobacterales bacterium]|nr:FRG domain-containing protein [Bryobacterales bacterium]
MAYRTETIGTWAQFRELADSPERKRWAFRGQAQVDAPLYWSLSRYLMTYGVHPDARPHQELRILLIIHRKGHQRMDQPPAEEDLFQWLALLQHHGAPTRLLDFTWSPYVAAFFALQAAIGPAVVWELCPPLLPVPEGMAPWIPGSYERDFVPNRHRVLAVGEPRRMNPRLSAQAGTFVDSRHSR